MYIILIIVEIFEYKINFRIKEYSCVFNKQAVVEKFLAGDMEVDEFLEQFLSQRKLMHLRKVKVDKLKELIRKSHSSTSGPGYPIAGNFPGIAPAVPYPTGHISMPMPVPSGLSLYRPY